MSTAVVSGGFPHLYRTDVSGARFGEIRTTVKYIVVSGSAENGSGGLNPLNVNGTYWLVPCEGFMGAGTRNCYRKSGGGMINNADLYIFMNNSGGGTWYIYEQNVTSYYSVAAVAGESDPPLTGWAIANNDVTGAVPTLQLFDESYVTQSVHRAVARADVAELHAALTPAVEVEPDHHLINIAAKRALTATEFKQMFYARGDDHFELANVYECPNIASNILASVWGKRQNYQGITSGIRGTFQLKSVEVGGGAVPPDSASFMFLQDAFYTSGIFQFLDLTPIPAAWFVGQPGVGIGVGGIDFWFWPPTTNPNGTMHAYAWINYAVPVANNPGVPNAALAHTNLVNTINWLNDNASWFLGATWNVTAAATSATVTTITSAVSSSSSAMWVAINVPGYTPNTQMIVQNMSPFGGAGDADGGIWHGSPSAPYNNSRIINYNRLGGRPDDPSGVDMAYGYASDLQRTFFAQFEVMGNLEKDLCAKRDCWTVCSRMSIEDQLYGLAFVAEDCDDVCMKVSCARKWSEVEDALAESCLAENNTIGYNDIVDLYINVRVTNANPKALDTIIRIRFPVQLTRGPDDLGNWNVVASNAADAVLTTGIPYDSVEGGNMLYANASQTETQAAANNQQQTQLPTSTAPANSNNSTDPHDGVPLS